MLISVGFGGKMRSSFVRMAGASLIAALLMVITAFGMMPDMGHEVYADEADPPAMCLVVNGGVPYINGAQQSSVWFGHYKQSSDGNGGFNVDPIKWRVLQNDSTGKKLFLLADQDLDARAYNEDSSYVDWITCTMRAWLNGSKITQGEQIYDYTGDNFISKALSKEEQKAVVDTATEGTDTTDRLFLLSVVEATNSIYGFTDNADPTDTRVATNTAYVGTIWNMYGEGERENWWLRTVGFTANPNNLACEVRKNGSINDGGIQVTRKDRAVRPALNLNLNSVLFTSAAEGGKTSGDEGALNPIGTNASNEWKLTLLDDGSKKSVGDGHKDFDVVADSVVTCDGKTIYIGYSGAAIGTNEYISAVVKNGDKVKFYGRIKALTEKDDASGTVTVNIDGKFDADAGDKLYVFNEQFNGDREYDDQVLLTAYPETDYASGLKEITIPEPAHKWKDATCTAPKTCERCSATEGAPLGHDPVFVAEVPATLEKEGCEEHYKCSRCEVLFRDSEGKIQASERELIIPKLIDIAGAEITVPEQTYTGKKLEPAPTVTMNGAELTAETDYTVSYADNKNAGTATATISGIGLYGGTANASFKINKAAQPMKVKARKPSVKYSKNKKRTIKRARVLKFTKKAKGKVSYKKISGSKYLTINKKNGAVTVKKGTAKGTYKIKIRVKAAGNKNYKAGTKKVTVKITVK